MKLRSKTLVVAIAVMALALCAARPSAAQVVTDLGLNLGASYDSSIVAAINTSGMAVGAVYTMSGSMPAAARAAVWLPGQVTATLLPLLSGYTDAMAMYVNANGLVAGMCQNGLQNLPQACVWSIVKGRWTVKGLGFLPGTTHDMSAPLGIDATGQVIGASENSDTQEGAGFIWDAVNGMREFTNLTGGSVTIKPSSRHGISDNGLVVGTAVAADGSDNGAIIWDSTTGQEVFHLETGEALTISPSGKQVAGYLPDATEPTQRNLVRWTWDDEQQAFVQSTLGRPPFPPASMGGTLVGWVVKPSGVTDDGKMIGDAYANYDNSPSLPGEYSDSIRWVYSGGGFTDLASVLPPGESKDIQEISMNAGGLVAMNVLGPGAKAYLWTGEGTAYALTDLGYGYARAFGLNDDGLVVGFSAVTSTDYFPVHAVLWSPSGVSALTFSTPTVSVKGKTLTITVKMAASNPNNQPATDAKVESATLNGENTTTPLPLVIGTVKVGGSKTISLTFAGMTSGQEVELKISGTCALGDFFTTQTVIIP